MSLSLVDPARLHQQALQNVVSLDSIPFAAGLTAGKRWAPESLIYFSYLPSRHLLTDDDMAFLGEFTALAICEQFIYLEGDILVPAVEHLLARKRGAIGAELRHCMIDLIEEEHRHTEMFWRLLETARPEWYPERKTRIHRAARRQLVQLMSRMPETFMPWVWMGLLFEEITVHLYRQYSRDPAVDPLFTEVHRAHMLDETRHFRIEQHLLREVWEPASPGVRAFNARLFGGIMARFVAPNSPFQALRLLLDHAPHLRQYEATFAADLRELHRNEGFQRNFYSREALPMTFATLDAHPEMAIVSRSVPLYDPGESRARAFVA